MIRKLCLIFKGIKGDIMNKLNENDELYGGDPSVLEDAIKHSENVRRMVKKNLKPAEDAAKELIKDTATEASKTRININKALKAMKVCEALKDRFGDKIINEKLPTLDWRDIYVALADSELESIIENRLMDDYYDDDEDIEIKRELVNDPEFYEDMARYIATQITEYDRFWETLNEIISDEFDDYMSRAVKEFIQDNNGEIKLGDGAGDTENEAFITHVKTRKELTPIIEEAKKNKRKFTVCKSCREGYRYEIKVEKALNEAKYDGGEFNVEEATSNPDAAYKALEMTLDDDRKALLDVIYDALKNCHNEGKLELTDESCKVDEASSAVKKTMGDGPEADDAYVDLITGQAIARVKDPNERNMLIAQHKLEKSGKHMTDRQSVRQTLKRKMDQAHQAYFKKAQALANKGYKPQGTPEEGEGMNEAAEAEKFFLLVDGKPYTDFGGEKVLFDTEEAAMKFIDDNDGFELAEIKSTLEAGNGYGNCPKCGTHLNDSGECPLCDLGDESVLDEAGIKSKRQARKASEGTKWQLDRFFKEYKKAGCKLDVSGEGDKRILTITRKDGSALRFDTEDRIIADATVRDVEECREAIEGIKKKVLDEALIYIEDISEFEPWAGAVDTWDKIVEANKLEELDFILEDFYPDGISRTALNDLLWFEGDWVLEQLGIKITPDNVDSIPEDELYDGELDLPDDDDDEGIRTGD